MSWRSRAEIACDHAALGTILFMLTAPALAFGGEYYWARAATEMVAAGLGVIWGARLLWGSPVPPRPTRSSTATGLIVGLVCLLALPLLSVPPTALQHPATRPFEVSGRALPGWPAQAPFAEILTAAPVEPTAGAEPAHLRPRSWRAMGPGA